MTYTVLPEEDGLLLRDVLKDRLGISHRLLAALKRKEQGILLNGNHATVRVVVKAGDELALSVDDTQATAIEPVFIPIEILFEDEYIVACNKPSGMPTHPSFRHHTDTLANALAYRYQSKPYVFRAINRLDRETDGVVLIAKHAYAAAKFGEMMQSGALRKEYHAVVGKQAPEKGQIESPICRESDSIIKRTVSPNGEYACTRFERIRTEGEHSLLRVFPITGRTHQIRVHMASIGFPLQGDTLYGGSASFPRTALHAHSISFVHPFTQESLCITAPIPSDLLSSFPSLYL